jgi:hypothetical protein
MIRQARATIHELDVSGGDGGRGVGQESVVGDELLFDPDSIYVVLFAAPIGVLAVVDLLRPALRGGTLYRAGLGAAGGVVALIERDHLRLNFAFVKALLLYGAVCAIALLEWRSRRSVQQRSS